MAMRNKGDLFSIYLDDDEQSGMGVGGCLLVIQTDLKRIFDYDEDTKK